MKKIYQKPGIYVENFGLSQSIAATCGVGNAESTLGKPSLADKNSCGWDMGNMIIWVERPACKDLMPDTDMGFGCYNNPNGGVTVFGWS